MTTRTDSGTHRSAPIDLAPDEFRALGRRLVDAIADWLGTMPSGRVTSGESVAEIRRVLASHRALPESGEPAADVLADATTLLFEHSLFNGHPRFFGYITSSPAPIGALGDLLAGAINQNMGPFKLSPLATEIEAQTVRWIAELIGYPAGGDGLLVSGGNMANFVCFLAARAAKATWNIRAQGLAGQPRLRAYASSETHTWLQKAADMFGLGTDAIAWIPVDGRQRMNVAALEAQIDHDRARGDLPFLVVGTAGSVGTGAVDPLPEIAEICRARNLWFHADGAYGGLAAQVPGAPESLRAISLADSVAVDPHKWLYSPLEAGCVLVRRPDDLTRAFSYHPAYYHFTGDDMINFVDRGPQNSRGFRALKVWLGLRQVGRSGAIGMIADDMRLSRHLDALARANPEFEALSQDLSIATFRYVPPALTAGAGTPAIDAKIDDINREILTRLEQSGEAFLSNAVVDGKFALRACIVNFRTSLADIEGLLPLIARIGRDVAATPDSSS
ncbi:MAG TPA: aspartate aminotransferase family protein [Vicinamibacterales bacterium]|nr:aspartate aminotransferase family protein [Vicinamibacterales bacterium]